MPAYDDGQAVDYDVQPSDPGPDPPPEGNGLWMAILKLLGLA